MSNETIILEGKVRWASVPPNPPRKPYEIDNNNPDDCSYSIEVECSKAKFEELKKLGIPRLTELKEDDDGTTYIRVRASKIKGQYTFPDPAVIDITGAPLNKKIGNGSEAKVKIELATLKGRKGVVLRLKAVMVTKLIEFDADDISDLLATAVPFETDGAPRQDVTPNEDW
jgi:hypothetical protein